MSKFLQFTDAESGKQVCFPKEHVFGFSGHKDGATSITDTYGKKLLAMESVSEIHNRMRD